MNHFVVGSIILAVLASGTLGGCEKGPGQKAGEKLDQAVGKLTGQGPVEKAGERIDKAVDELKKK
jgi:hypothetical protein